jgi:hypothetical protein
VILLENLQHAKMRETTGEAAAECQTYAWPVGQRG